MGGKGVSMLDMSESVEQGFVDDSVVFLAAGERAKGEYCCSECQYGVVVWSTLPACPMCGGDTWEETAWSPFTRAGAPI